MSWSMTLSLGVLFGLKYSCDSCWSHGLKYPYKIGWPWRAVNFLTCLGKSVVIELCDMSFQASFAKIFLVPHAWEKRENNIAIHTCIIVSWFDLCDLWYRCHEYLGLYLCHAWMLPSLVIIYCDMKLLDDLKLVEMWLFKSIGGDVYRMTLYEHRQDLKYKG